MSLRNRILLIASLVFAVCVGVTSHADAQFRRGPHVVVGVGVYEPYWGYYDPWWGYAQWGPYPYPPPMPYRYAYRDPGAAVRLEVKPKEAEVYVDGFYAGIVDDYDGVFQRLRVAPGEHEITLYLDGYRTTTQKVYLTPDSTFKIKYNMERLAAGEQAEPRPQPPAPPPGMQQQPPYPPQQQPPYPTGAPLPQPGRRPMPPPPSTAPAPTRAEGYGKIAVRVQPADADVLIDGQVWHGSDREALTVDVSEGRHAIEIRKSGYRTYVTEIDVRRGETVPINVSLRGSNE